MENNEFAENLTGKDVKFISEKVGCSVSTVYKYLSGDIPENGIGKRTADEIFELGKNILLERGEKLITIANNTESL